MSEIREGEKKSVRNKRSQITLELSGAAIFSALSIVIGVFLMPTVTEALRIPGWFIAIIDLISLVWMLCYLLFGVRAGLICSVVGAIGLIPYDPTGWVGPMMKLVATLSLISIQIIFLKLYKSGEGSSKLKRPRNYFLYGVLGTLLRMVVMTIMNIAVILALFSFLLPTITLEFIGLPQISGLTAVIIGAPIINAWQSGLDLIIPYFIVFGSKLDEKYEIW